MLAFQKQKPDLAILDVELHDGKVFPFAQTLIAEDVPVIFYSGRFSPEEVKEHFPTARALSKPCPPSEMLQAVNDVLEQRSAANG